MTAAAQIVQPAARTGSTVNCIEFVGQNATVGSPHVQPSGRFWNDATSYGRLCFNEVCYKYASDGYVISGSTGGSHTTLFGLNGSGQMLGQFWNSAGVGTTHASNITVTAGEWAVLGYGLMQASAGGDVYKVFYKNGIAAGIADFATFASGITRKSPGVGTGGGTLWVGHSDHQNAQGRLAAIRTFETENPISNAGGIAPAYIPDRAWGNDLNTFKASLFYVFNTNSGTVPDLSDGFDPSNSGGTKYTHPGIRNNGAGNGYPAPSLVNDSSCLYGASGDFTNTYATVPAVPALPSGSPKIFDSFNRYETDYLWAPKAGPDIGQTDSRATLGSQSYTQVQLLGGSWDIGRGSGRGFAIQNGMLRSQSNTWFGGYVDVGTGDFDVRIKRLNATNMGHTGLFFRYVDTNNWLGLYTNFLGITTNNIVYPMNVVGGVNGVFGTSWTPATNTSWTTLRAVAVGNTITVMVDNGAGAGWETLGTITDNNFGSSGKVGPAVLGGAGALSSSTWNGDDFTVF